MLRLPKAVRRKSKNLELIPKFLASAALCLLFWSAPVCAKSLAEYKADLGQARELTRELLDYVEENLEEEAPDLDYEREILAEIRRIVPAAERIEWEGNVTETGNQWLTDKLKAFEETPPDWSKRHLILAEASDRLAAIENRIGELETPGIESRSKDEDKRKLSEILRREEYQKPVEAGESWFQRLQRKIREWFNQKFPQPDLPESAGSGLQSVSLLFQILLYVAILGLIGFLIYRFAPFLAGRFRRERPEREERVILGEKLGIDENARSLFGEAEELARTGDPRGAIRKGYIALLCELSDRRIIGLARHKTNRDYLRDVRKKSELYRNMHGLTNNYERHWYGFEEANEADWHEFKREYQKTVGQTH